ncbi:hypothetical protein D3C73_1539930 [compost metagenome]
MVKAGLITRQRSQTDRRIYHLAVTDKGREIWELSKQSVRKHLQPLEELPAEDVKELLRLHGEIIKIFIQGREDKKL